MDEKTFHLRADETLETVFDKIEAQLGDRADVDWEEGILTVAWDGGETYVINKHAPNSQIWMSSPLSGASHFSWDAAAAAWCNTRGGEELLQTLEEELTRTAGARVTLR
ncbi:iron donor protein CyaY [Varunaivibrio sulfuroxidans]|uniref:Frataxin n=1 Tax=Varunaivibrio sulfuroxidans TaxID=1773489 RepID=A0A4R3JD56_9PROT|nr:iron donor protein CyaY [Varunaivibrio sulfuroxidans]TCS63126.1 frataxin [Varunaivibrio sulfuroxidans]WES31804.1 iron donor protein CyaY [Varunaivibrio sulfuroxidans]